jgi:iron(III) transport system permease protein
MATARVVAGRLSYPTSRVVLVTALTGAACAALLALIVWPLVTVIVTGVVQASRVGMRLPFEILARTLAVAAASTALTVLVAAAVTYAIVRTRARGGALTHRLLSVGLLLPPFVPALGVLLLSGGRTGVAPLVTAQVLSFLPYAYLALGNALAALDHDQENAAESLGAGRIRILTRITLVLLRPGLVSAAIVVALLCLADFVNPVLVGGDSVVLSTLIFVAATRAADPGSAAALALWLVAPCIILAALGRWRAAPAFAMPPARPHPHRPTPAALSIVTGAVGAVVLAVYASVAVGSIVTAWGRDWTPTLRHLAATATEHGRALAGSVVIAAAVAVGGTVLALLVAGIVARGGRVGTTLEHASLLPAVVPGLVLGLGFFLAYAPSPLVLAAAAPLSAAAVVAARLPVAARAAIAAVRGLDADVVLVARSLGADRRRAFSRVLAPLLTPVAGSILAYLFARALVAVSAVVLLVGSRLPLASLRAIDVALGGRTGEACALAIALSVMVVVVVRLRRTLPGREHVAMWFL